MAKQHSSNYNTTVNSLQQAESALVLLEIDHDDLPAPIRVVNDPQDIEHNGNTFQAMGFSFVWPDDPESGMPEAKLRMDNVGRELTGWFETADFSKPTTVRAIQVMRSAPDTVEFEVTLNLSDINVTMMVVEGRLSFDDFYGMPACAVTYNAKTFPGIVAQ